RETQIAPYDRQFASKTVGQRAMQLFAGPMMNFILAIVIFIILGLVQGVPSDKAVIGDVQPDSPAKTAGLEAGDEVVQVNDTAVSTWMAFTEIIQQHPNEQVELAVVRDDKDLAVTVVPREIEVEDTKIGQLGVTLAFEKSLIGTFKYGFIQTYETTTLILQNLFMLVTGQLSIEMLSGPVGIYDATDQVVQTGFMNFLMWTAMLSINLGIINLVPLPALDGGRLLFVGIEAVRGKPIDPQKEGFVHVIGFALLMLLMIVVTWNDIQRLFM
ncbi:MAG TPA: RIP metalloprotease RseP, partial [Pseudogracilibacillus sp.]|nr:RIP metalloprotease RseP [Pseudogracilibacillus sp.]